MEDVLDREKLVIPEGAKPLGHVIYDAATSRLIWEGPKPPDSHSTTFILAISRNMPVKEITLGPNGFQDDPVSTRWLRDPAIDPTMQVLFQPEPDKKVSLMVFPNNSLTK